MATITATKAGNWSDTSVWDLGRVPQADDDVALSGYVIVWDTSITRIPATGSLASISSTGTAGQISIALDDAAFHGGATLDVGTGNITAGTKPATSGLILITGTTDHVLNITGNLVGGSNAGAYCVNHQGTGTINIVGNLTDSSTTSTGYAFNNGSTGTVNITGNLIGGAAGGFAFNNNAANGIFNITGNLTGGSNGSALRVASTTASTISGVLTGGSGNQSWAVTVEGANSNITLSSTSILVQGEKSSAWNGKAPAWQPASTSYAKYYVGASFGQAANTEFPQVLSAANIKAGVTSGSVTGTLSSGGTLIGKGSLVG
jgi:hypothetical protein